MASTKNLLTISYHDDDYTGIYKVGEIDFGVHGTLSEYIKTYGYEGVKEIMATLGYLCYAVQKEWNKQSEKGQQAGSRV